MTAANDVIKISHLDFWKLYKAADICAKFHLD